MKVLQRILSWLLVMCLVVSMLPQSAWATESGVAEHAGDNISWSLDNDVLTVSGEGTMPDYNSGTAPWYDCREDIREVVIEDGITNIGNDAFEQCSNLTMVSIPGSVASIDQGAFFNCTSLESITIPEGVKYMEIAVFWGCSKLSTVSLPSTIIKIANTAFYVLHNLKDVYYNGTEKQWNAVDFDGGNSYLLNATIHFKSLDEDNHKHSYTATVIEPTCTESGYTIHACSCGDSYSDAFTDRAPHHLGDWWIYLDADCTTPGEERQSCNWCDYHKRRKIPAYGHNLGDWYEYTIADCTYSGEERRDCERCYNYYESREIPVLGHQMSSWNVVIEPTLLEDGQKERYCERCWEWEYQSIPRLTLLTQDCGNGLSWTLKDWVLKIEGEGIWESGCLMENFEYRNRIETVLISEGVTKIGENGFIDCHNLASIQIPASVTTIADYAFSFCDLLEEVFYAGTEEDWARIAVGEWNEPLSEAVIHFNWNTDHQHDYTADITVPGCYDQGYTTYTCSCGTWYITERTWATDHTLGNWYVVEEATEEDPTVEQRDCANCEYSETRCIGVSGHIHSYWDEIVEPTCTQQGYTRHWCNGCEYYYDDTYIPGGHDYFEEVVPPSCKEKGFTLHLCHNCNDSYRDNYTDVQHEYNQSVIDPTCTKKGFTEYHCYYCNDHYVVDYVDALGHRFSGWEPIKEATLEADGQEIRRCNVCHETEERVLPKLESLSGNFGESLYWNLKDGVLTFTGEGSLRNENFGPGEHWRSSNHLINTIVLSEGITEIGDYVFDSMYNVSSIQIPSTVTRIGTRAFYHCVSLENVYYEGSAEDWKKLSIGGENEWLTDATIYFGETDSGTHTHNYSPVLTEPTCTDVGYTTYTCSCGHKQILDITVPLGHMFGDWYETIAPTEMTDGEEKRDCERCGSSEIRAKSYLDWTFDATTGTLTISGNGRMRDYDENYEGVVDTPWFIHSQDVKKVVMEEGVTAIGRYAFSRFPELTEVSLPDSVTTIGACSFMACTALEQIHIPNNVTKIGCYAFQNCTAMKEIAVPEYVALIEYNTFQGCVNLESVDLPDSVTEIEFNAFEGCTALKEIAFPKNLEVIGTEAFLDCTELEKADLGKSINYISYKVFMNCTSLKEIWIPVSLEEVGGSAFSGCENLTNVFYAGLEEQWNDINILSGNQNLANASIRYGIGSGHVHEYATIVTPPTCTEQGYTTRTCICGDKQMQDIIAASGHRAGEWSVVKEATEEETGERRINCKTCGLTLQTETIDKLPHSHSYTAVVTKPTCKEQGYTTYTCKCGDSYVDDYTEANGHRFGDWYITKEPTEESEGGERRECDTCGHFETRTLSKLPHEHHYTSKVTASTCTEKGYTTYTCECGHSYMDDYTDTVGHSLGGWYEDKPPAVTEPGIERRECNNCDYYETQVVYLGGTCGTNATWTLYNGLLSISGSGSTTSYQYNKYAPWYDYRSDITSVKVQEGILAIGAGAFSGCSNLTNVDLPDGLTTISNQVFINCEKLSTITLPDDVKFIGESAFRNCSSLTKINIPANVGVIYSSTFYGCISLEEATIPYGVYEIGHDAFAFCSSLTSLAIPSSVTSIKSDAFYKCSSLTSLTIPSGVTSIESDTFYECSSLTSIILPNTVTSIGEHAFYHCVNLTNIIIPESVTYIGESAFSECKSIRDIAIPYGVTSIKDYTFYNCDALNTVTIPNSVTTIGIEAFASCGNLSNIIIPESVCSIGSAVFADCYNLSAATIPGSISNIEESMFSSCDNLTNVVIQEGVVSIGKYAFAECRNLKTVTLPDSLKSIGDHAFVRCGFTNIVIPDNVTNIGKGAFHGSKLRNITLPQGITEIKSATFTYCERLTSIVIPVSVVRIEDQAIGATDLTDVYYTGSEIQWKSVEIAESNTDLRKAKIHYVPSTPEEDPEDDTNINGTVQIFRSWDPVSQAAYFDDGSELSFLSSGYQVTEETDTSFLENISSLLGSYVLAETTVAVNGAVRKNVLLSIRPVQTKTGIVDTVGTDSITIGGNTYSVGDNVDLTSVSAGDAVMYHLYNNILVGIGTYIAADDIFTDDEDPHGASEHFGPDHRVDISGQLSFSPKELRIIIQNTQLTSDILSEKEKDALRIKNAKLLVTLPTGWTFSGSNSRTNLLPIADIPLGQSVTIDLPVNTDGTGYKTVTAAYSENDEVIFTEKISIYLPDTPSITITPDKNDDDADNQRAEEYHLSAGNYETIKIPSGKNYIVQKGTSVTAAKVIVEGNLSICGNLTANNITIQGNGDLDVSGSVTVTDKMKLNGGNLFSTKFCRCDLSGTANIAELVMDGSCTVKPRGNTTIGICRVKGGYFNQYYGNLIITDMLEVTGKHSSFPACHLEGGTLWLEGNLKQSWHSGNFQATGDHVTIKTNSWNEDSIQFAKNASDNVYLNHLYVDEAIAADIEAYDLTDFAIKYVMGDFCKATIDKNARTYKVIKNSNINSQEEFELQVQEALSQEITFALKNDGRIKEALGSDGYEVFSRLAKSWIVAIHTELAQDKIGMDQISRKWAYNVITIGDNCVVVCADMLSNSVNDLSFLYWYGKVGDTVYSKDDKQVLGIGAFADRDEFMKKANIYLVKSAAKKIFKMLALSEAAKTDELVEKLVRFAFELKSFSKNADKLAKQASFYCSFVDSENALPDIPSTYSASVSTAAHSSISNSVALSVGDPDVPEILTQAHSGTVATSTVIISDGDQTEVKFTDPLLEQILRNALGKDTDETIVSADVQQITVLNLRDYQLYSLDGLEYFVNLKELYISGNNLRSLQPISGLTNLEILDAGANRIADISSLSTLQRLRELSISNNLITDLSPLSGLTALETLELDHCPIESYDGLSQLTGLKELNISGNEIPDHNLSILSELRSLTILIANDCNLSSVSGLTGDALEYLYLQNNAVSSLDTTELPNLVLADLSENGLEDISALESVKKMEILYVRGNALDDNAAASLQNLESLKALDISANRITSLNFLSGMESLEKLDAHSNSLSNISGLNGHTALSVLILDSCDLTDAQMCQLTDLSGITHLQMRHNELTDSSFLSLMPVLSYADLSYNQIDVTTVPDAIQDMVDTTVAPIFVRRIQLAADGNLLLVGKTMQIACYVYPVLADISGIVWESDNTDVATINDDGIVNGISEGEVTVTATTTNGVSAQVSISVSQRCEHNYGKIDFVWVDYNECSAVISCAKCAERQVLNCTVSSVTSPATEAANGSIVYTATVEFDGSSYTDTQTVIIPAIDHESHVPASEWLSDNSYHWRTCSVCSERLDVQPHIHGNATCIQKAVCTVCSKSYGELAPHDFLETWSQGDENGHWHQCKNCNAHDTQVNHVPGPEATENTSQHCTTCGYVLHTPLGLDWFADRTQDPNSYLWASGYYAKIMEQYSTSK